MQRRRLIVAELSQRTNEMEAKESIWQQEQDRMAAEKRDQMKAVMHLEQERVEEEIRLADKEKEERLRQIAIVEQTYRANLARQRRLWQEELSHLQEATQATAKLTEAAAKSRLEAETIRTLEFEAQQRMIRMEEDRAQEAALSRLRLANQSFTSKMEAELAQKQAEWNSKVEEQTIRLASEKSRQSKLALVDEEMDVHAKLTIEQIQAQIQHDKHLSQVRRSVVADSWRCCKLNL